MPPCASAGNVIPRPIIRICSHPSQKLACHCEAAVFAAEAISTLTGKCQIQEHFAAQTEIASPKNGSQ